VYGKANGTHDIAVGYGADFTELTADAGKFTSVDLSGYLIGALSLIGRSLLNNADRDLVSFVVRKMAEAISVFVEGELLNGTGAANSHCTGALSTTNTMNAGSVSAISADNLIDLQAKVKQAFQKNAVWTMHPTTWSAIKKLKDKNDRYLVQDDITGEFPFRLLGKPVYLSDSMPAIASAAKAVLYGDYSGLSVNIRENMTVEVLREKYATQHAVGVVAWMELDSKVSDPQKLATLVMSTGAAT
jgi:HK97 family phage major capsid protein